MAELDVQPKKSKPWWLWLLLALLAIGLIFFLMRGCDRHDEDTTATTTTTETSDTTTTTSTTTTTTTDDDWNNLDRNVPAAAYDEITDKDIEVRGNDNYSIYSLVLFDSDQSTIQPAAEAKLKQVAASLGKRFNGARVRIYGYTDASGTKTHNKELAEKRAQAVQDWLVNNGNISKEQVSLHPIGEAQPAETNTTEKGKEQNRRVEIVARR